MIYVSIKKESRKEIKGLGMNNEEEGNERSTKRRGSRRRRKRVKKGR